MSERANAKFGFEWMLEPIAGQTFLNEYLNSQPLRIQRNDSQYYSDLLGEDDLEFALLSASSVRGAVEELLAGDQARPCKSQAHAVRVYKSGKSLRIVGIQRFSKNIAILCRALTAALQCRVQVNLYLTPGGSKALNKHFDTHDVFVLQVHGTKVWTLYNNPITAPLEVLPLLRHERTHEMKRYRLIKHRYSADDAPQRDEFTLEGGELLYLPRGYWHNAQSEPGKVSCHLTVGLQAVTYTDLLTTTIGQASFSDPRMRESLPRSFLFDEQAAAQVAERMKTILKTLEGNADIATSLGQLSRNLAQSERVAIGNGLLAGVANDPQDVSVDSIVCVREGILLGLDTSADPHELCFQEKSFGVAAQYLPAVRWIARHRELRVRELPGDLTDEQRVLFVRDLLTVGLLEMSRTSGVPGPGWFPVHADAQKDIVDLLDCAQDNLPEPFAKQSFARIKADSPASAFTKTSLSEMYTGPAGIHPAGFIFHVSRCGSTLLANCMKQLTGALTISEPQPVSNLLQFVGGESVGDDDELQRRLSLLKVIVEAYGRRRNGSSPYLLKLTSWNILQLPVFRQLWPDTPCVILLRDPLEVGVSCIETPPGWMSWRKRPAPWLTEAIGTVARSREAFCAQMLGQFYKVARGAVELGGVSTALYDDLNLGKSVEVARLFGFSPTEAEQVGMERVLGLNAKHPELGSFEKDSGSKRSRASVKLTREVDLWARAAFEELCGGKGLQL